jgi:hypothetical protein
MNGNSKDRLSHRELRVGATQTKVTLKLAREHFGETEKGESFYPDACMLKRLTTVTRCAEASFLMMRMLRT